MEKGLYDAALNNDVPTLIHLLKQDPHLLERTNFNCEDKNPLHAAVMQENVEFVQEILKHKGSFCMCLARDRDGRNPLHLAAMYGKLKVLPVLVQRALAAALEKADGGGTILHLCVKYNQREALKFLTDILADRHFQNAKNEDGMTILHLAIYYNHKQITKYLLEESRVGVNVKNANGKTALDLLLGQSKTGEIDEDEMREILEDAHALKGKNVRSPTDWSGRQREWYDKSRDAMMVVASLIATMAFQAGVSPPGGVWSDDLLEGPNPHRAGEAVMAQTHPKYYRHLIRANTIAFVSALSTIVLLIRGWGIPSRYILPLLAFAMHLSVITTAITYAISLGMTEPKSVRGHLSIAAEIVIIVLMVWIGWMITIAYEICAKFKRSSKFKSWMESGYEQY